MQTPIGSNAMEEQSAMYLLPRSIYLKYLCVALPSLKGDKLWQEKN
jgi:hypothetical protein